MGAVVRAGALVRGGGGAWGRGGGGARGRRDVGAVDAFDAKSVRSLCISRTRLVLSSVLYSLLFHGRRAYPSSVDY